MKLKAQKNHTVRRKVDLESWEKTIESLAMDLCPTKEWQAYEKKAHFLAWKNNKQSNTAKIRVFPIWRKYRQQALRVATLYRTLPILRYFPLKVTNFLGQILFK
jgi:hypothetical protein